MIGAVVVGAALSNFWQAPPTNEHGGRLVVLVACPKMVDSRRVVTKVGCVFVGRRAASVKAKLDRSDECNLVAQGELYTLKRDLFLSVATYAIVPRAAVTQPIQEQS